MNILAAPSMSAQRSASEALVALLLLAASPIVGERLAASVPFEPLVLQAETVRVLEAPDADQGVVVDRDHFYAIDNHVIARHRLRDGRLEQRWDGGGQGPIRHLNSCARDGRLLVCANSNYPVLPMGSSVEWFDPASMRHVGSHSLGLHDEGSLVWAERLGEGWIAGFAHYDRADGRGGTGFKDSRYGNVVLFDRAWRRVGGWLIPNSVQARLTPHSASGGALGPDGLLYLSGHDRPELYVMAKPKAGPYLVHLATITVESEGQAFGFLLDDSRRIMVVDRRRKLVREISLPPIAIPDHAAEKFLGKPPPR